MKKIICIFLAFSFFSCTEQKPDQKEEGEKLMQLSREWSRLASTDSIEQTLSYWADDAVVMSPGQAPIKGKAAIREMVTSSKKIPGFHISWEPLSVEVSGNGDMAYLVEQSIVTMQDSTGKSITEYNKGVTVWKKQADGSWKNVVDIWNAAPAK